MVIFEAEEPAGMLGFLLVYKLVSNELYESDVLVNKKFISEDCN